MYQWNSHLQTKLTMASSVLVLLLLLIGISFTLPAAQASFRPRGFVLPVTKDPATRQYLTTLGQRTPLVSMSLVVDLGGQFVWNDCETNFRSSSYKVLQCHTAACAITRSKECGNCFRPEGPGCRENTSCKIWPNNPVRNFGTNGDSIQDVVVLRSTDGSNPGRLVKVPKFLSGCTGNSFLEQLAQGVTGMVGLGRWNTAMATQLAHIFSFPRKFAVCLGQKGVVIIGDGPYHFLPFQTTDYAKSLTYTPLLLNKVSKAVTFEGEPSAEYYIGVKSIKVNGKTIKLNSTILEINSQGYGGTKISSVDPYMVVESSIYKSITRAFRKEMARFQKEAPVAPFGLCYNSTRIQHKQEGPDVPPIDLVLQNSKVYWRIHGSNSMVQVSKDVLCLGIIDGGLNFQTSPSESIGLVTSIIIGGHQIENNLLQFDQAASKLGFSSSLLMHQTSCSGFNFTSTA